MILTVFIYFRGDFSSKEAFQCSLLPLCTSIFLSSSPAHAHSGFLLLSVFHSVLTRVDKAPSLGQMVSLVVGITCTAQEHNQLGRLEGLKAGSLSLVSGPQGKQEADRWDNLFKRFRRRRNGRRGFGQAERIPESISVLV